MFTGKYDQAINSVLLIAKASIQVSICLGVIVTIIYCGTINFYPSGLTIGDTLFFIAASLAFAVSYTVLVFAIISAGITISPIFRWLQPLVIFIINSLLRFRKKEEIKNKINFPVLGFDSIGPVVFGFIFILITTVLFYSEFDRAFNLTLAILLMSFIYGAWHTKPTGREKNEGWEKKVKVGLFIVAYLVPLVIMQAKGNFLNQSMDMIGVRAKGSAVQLSKKYTDFLTDNKILYTSKSPEGEGRYSDVVVLFRGIGSSIFIKVEKLSLSVQAKDIIIGQ